MRKVVCKSLLILLIMFGGNCVAADGYYIAINNESKGPYNISELKKLMLDGEITKDSSVWKEGMDSWGKLINEPELKVLLAKQLSVSAPPPINPVAPPILESKTTPHENLTILTPDVTSPVTSYKKEGSISTLLNEKVRQLEKDILKTPGVLPYQIAGGLGTITGDKNSQTYLDDLYLGYRQAIADAYVKLVIKKTGVQLKDKFTSDDKKVKGHRPSNANQCRKKFIYHAEQAEYDNNSLLGILKNKLKGENQPDENAADGFDEIIKCDAIGDTRKTSAMVGQIASGSLSGIRVFETFIKGNSIAVIIGNNPDTNQIAGALKQQRQPSKINLNVEQEVDSIVKKWISDFEKAQQGPPFGLIGTRMKKLSNGEWLVVGIGVSQMEGGNDEMSAWSNTMSIEGAQTLALNELNRFAYSSISRKYATQVEKTVNEVITETLNMSKNGEKESISERMESALRNIMTRNIVQESKNFIRSPYDAYGAEYSGGNGAPFDFYLSVYAWSPSLMELQSRRGKANDRAFEGGKRSSNSSRQNSGQGEMRSYRLDEDW